MNTLVAVSVAALLPLSAVAADTVKLGLNYPKTGSYFAEGLDQIRAAQMAVEEVNADGGILGKKVELIVRDGQNSTELTEANVRELIDKEGVSMVFGGSASNVAIAAGEVCQEKKVPFFATLSYSNATTGADAHRFTFRECYNAWMGAKVLSKYMKEKFPGKKYFYITSNYTWGWTTENSMRVFTGTTDKAIHRGVFTPYPVSGSDDFRTALLAAAKAKPDVLVIVLFGTDMVNTINMAVGMGLKKRMQIVVPNLTLAMAEGSGAANMSGVLGALPWARQIAYKLGSKGGIHFVEAFTARFGRYPSTSGASAYTIVHEFKAAAERAKSLDGSAIVKALEGHHYTLLKDEQVWRAFDHQSEQTVYAVRCNPPEVVNKDKLKLDYFEVIDSLPGSQAAKTQAEWEEERLAAGRAPFLEKLPGEY